MKNIKLKNFSVEEINKWKEEGIKFQSVFESFSDYTRFDFINKIVELIEQGTINVNYKANPVKKHWDGLIFIEFIEEPRAEEVVQILRLASCDSFEMKDKKLTVWWD